MAGRRILETDAERQKHLFIQWLLNYFQGFQVTSIMYLQLYFTLDTVDIVGGVV